MKHGRNKVQLRTDISLKLAITDVTPIFQLQSSKQTYGMLNSNITLLFITIILTFYTLVFSNIFRHGFKEMLLLF